MTVEPKVKHELEQADEITAKYTYVLSAKSEKRGMIYDSNNAAIPDPPYPRQRNLLLRSSIIWPKDSEDPFTKGKTRYKGKHLIRYYDGCTTLFVDDQPKDKETIDQLIRSTRGLFFQNGYLHIYAYDAILKMYMDWASWNEESIYRVPTIDAVYKLLDSEKERQLEAVTIDEVEKALEYAKSSDENKMFIHAKFIDVPTVDYNTGNKLSMKAIRVEYRKAAMNDPKRFLRTFNDKTMHVRYWITQAIERGEISTSVVPNKASWGKKGQIICDISGLQNPELILNKLIEFSQTDEGKDFEDKLKAIYG